MLQGLLVVTRALEIAGAGTLILGFLIATARCFRQSRQQGAVSAIHDYRRALGRVVLIGLEILVAATIIKTITIEPSWESMGYLAIMVVIRTLLSWTTVLEMDGRWPWQRPKANPSKS